MTVFCGSFAKASSVGANTVNGPSPLMVSTNPEAFKAVTRVLNLPSSLAISTISFELFCCSCVKEITWV